MTDGVAQDQIVAYVDRVLRMKEERKAIDADIREIYAEAKGNGFDKTVLGKLVSYVEKRADGASELAEAEAIFDLYLSAYDAAKSGPRQARTSMRVPAREIIEEFDADGVEIEQPATAQQKVGGFPVPAAPLSRGGTGGDGPTENDGRVNANPSLGVTGGESAASSEGPRQSALVSELADGGNASHNESETAGETATPFQAYDAPTALSSDVVKMPTREEGILRLRPNCQNPGACKSSGGKKHCWSCSNSVSEATTGGAA